MMNKSIKAFKGFHMDMTCNGFQFEVGKSYKHGGKVKICSSGFHSCEYPLDVFSYYGPSNSRYAIVKATGKTDHDSGDTKFAAANITIEAEIKLPDMVQHAVDWIKAQLNPAKIQTVVPGYRSAATNTGYRSAATNTGYQSAATNTGDQSAATNTGDQSAATNTGYQSAATNTGDRSAATNTGDLSAATNTGDRGAATNTGDRSAHTNTGDRSAATNTGDQSAATNTGYQSAATNTGDRSAATNTGGRSAATNTGDQSAAEVTGKNSVAIAAGYESRSRATKGSAIVVCERDNNGNLISIACGIAGKEKIKSD